MNLLQQILPFAVALSSASTANSSACEDSANPRECYARELLQTLVAGGATLAPVGLHARQRLTGGLGVFVSHPVPTNTSVLTIPRQLMLAFTFCPPHASACAVEKRGSTALLGLGFMLGRERQSPSASHLAAYLKTLPSQCPPNLAARLAARASADVDLLATSSLHAEDWLVHIRKDFETLAQELPEVNETERRLLACLVQSRVLRDTSGVLADDSYMVAMVPFADLLNHGTERNVYFVWDAASGLSLVTARKLNAGDELVFPYGDPGSKAWMLLAFGFIPADAPAAVIPTDHLPEGNWTGCEGRPDIQLHENISDSEVGEAALRSSLRCARLRSYTPEMVSWALSSGYLEQSLLSPRSAFPEQSASLYEECVRKDAELTYFVMHACAEDLFDDTSDEFARFAAMLEADGISEELREVLHAEDAALRACNDLAITVLHNLVAHGCGVEEMLNQLAEEAPNRSKVEL